MKLSHYLLASAASIGFVTSGAAAQNASIAPPQRYQFDANGVDLVSGTFQDRSTFLTIGPSGPAQLRYERYFGSGNGGPAIYDFAIYSADGVTWAAQTGPTAEYFTLSGSTFTSTAQQGATLSRTGVGTTFTYTLTTSDGTQIVYDVKDPLDTAGRRYKASKIIYPSGDQVTISWASVTYCTKLSNQLVAGGGENSAQTSSGISAASASTTISPQSIIDCSIADQQTRKRIQAVSNNTGYQLHYYYQNDYVDVWNDNGLIRNNSDQWLNLTGVKGINTTVEACDPNAFSCTLTGNWPTVTLSSGGSGVLLVTMPGGGVWRYTYSGTSNPTYSIRRPTSSTDNVVVTLNLAGNSLTYAQDGQTWSYARAGVGSGTVTTTVTDPLGHQSIATANEAISQLLTYKDRTNRTTTYTYDGAGRLLTAQAPEGNKAQYAYDGRGNVTSITNFAKGSVGSITSYQASYPASCANPVICNKPTTSTDAGGNVTNYNYDATHGGTLSVTLPAPASGGVRPETRYGYTSYGGIYRQTSTSSCRTTASCTGTSDETMTTTSFTGGNLLPTTLSSGAGDGSLTATTTIGYDSIGNAISVDGSLPGSGDTSWAIYNADRQKVGTIGPDPDGSGGLLPRAQRITYDADGDAIQVDVGNVPSGATNLGTFTALQSQTIGYDGAKWVVSSQLVAGGATQALTQTSYDALGRVDCTVQRMNPAQFASPPSACSLGAEGSFGPDRITRTSYDDEGRTVLVRTAYGTSAQSDEAAASYTSNGQQATVTDGEGNLTTYEYDEYDRLSKTRFPNASGGGSSTNDYEQLSYDGRGNVTQRRIRDGQTISYSYDNLSRLTVKSLPSPEGAINYGYDNLGHVVSINQPWPFAGTLTYSYDALGRLTLESQLFGSISSGYDLAGRRTSLTHGDGLTINYEYLVTGEVTVIRENGATSGTGVLATYSYDNLGRRTSLSRGNGTTTSYGFDAASRLTSLQQDLGGNTYDQTLGFSYNPASQIASNTRSNDAYAWSGAYDVNRAYAHNGLNQMTSAGAVSMGYDGRGNLTSSGTTTYAYWTENQLKVASPGATMHLDPVGRLAQYDTSLSMRFYYDGAQLAAETETATGAIQRRYVYGPGDDEPIVWYEGAGTSQKYWLHADERGSVTAATDSIGNVVGTNTYDEYGVPGANNIGRFQYTGQAWFPEIGLYYYKARMYSPTLGRFMQIDPVGYNAGMNMHSYVGGDPINRNDPSGLACTTVNFYEYLYKGFEDGHTEYLGANFLGSWTVGCESVEKGFGRNENGGGGGGRVTSASFTAALQNDLICTGTATFSAVGPLPQAGGDSAFAPGTKPANGTVAIAGAQTFGFGRKALREGAAAGIKISPEGLDDVLRATGGPLPPYTVGDYGDVNIRNAPGSRFDIYRFSTMKGALAFGKRTVSVTYKVPAGGHCPPGSTAK